jgi:TonB-linked SusC/RagA family outer membrane protein
MIIKTYKTYTLSFLLTLVSFITFAQSITVSGKVTDDYGSPLPGVSVFVKGTKVTATSAIDGSYRITAPNESAIIVFSYLGFDSEERKAVKTGALNVKLKQKETELNTVVVTALNISKEQKALGYAAQTLDSTIITNAPSTNWMNALEGRVAGLNLNSAGGAMGSAEIILRGEKSLQIGSSGALIVVDGIPVNNSVPSQAGGAYMSIDSPNDIGTSAGDINPEDIASVTVLKGAAATALYGSRGSNGAIVIVTKSGSAKQGLGITVTSNTNMTNINKWPEYQDIYGAGGNSTIKHYSYGTSNAVSTSASSGAWGPKLDTGALYYQYDPATQGQSKEPMPWISYPNTRTDFFRTGLTTNNSIAIDGGNQSTTGRISITNLQNRYILENISNQKTTVSFSLDQKINKDMKLSTKVNYYNSSSDNLPVIGFNPRSTSYFLVNTPANVNIDWYRDYWRVTNGIRQVDVQQHRPFNSNIDNPYFVLYEVLNPSTRNGAFGNINFNYRISPFLSFNAKTGINMYNDITSNRQPKSSRNWVDGFYREQNGIRYEHNSDFLLTYKRPINKNFNLTLSGGGNSMRNSLNRTIVYLDRLLIPGQYTLANGVTRPIIRGYKEEKAISSLYAFGNISYKNYLFLELTGRNDWSSVFAPSLNSYFYPSANLSWVITDMLGTKSKTLSFAKIRASYAEVGSDTNPYRIEKYYSNSDFNSSVTNPTDLPNYTLRPERTKSYETGIDVRMFKNKVGIDLTYYLSDTYDQILRVPVDPASGYYNYFMNAGTVRNKGVEFVGWAKLIERRNGLNWRVNVNAAVNRGKIIELNDDIETISLFTMSPTALLGVKGGSIGDIYGLGYQRSPQGDIIYENGLPQLTEEVQKVGSAVPKFKGGIGTEFRYKTWRVNLLFDGEFGHQKFSLTHSALMTQGLHVNTLPGREEGAILGTGVVLNPDGTYSPNTTPVIPSSYFLAHYDAQNTERNIHDASYLKFREFRVEKTFTAKGLKKLGLNSATVGVYGRDLFIWTKWPAYDPQTSSFNNGTMIQGIEIGQMPSTRTIGLNLRFAL